MNISRVWDWVWVIVGVNVIAVILVHMWLSVFKEIGGNVP